MDDQIPTSTPVQPTVTTMPVQKTSYHSKKRIVMIVLCVLGVVIIAGAVWLIIRHHKKAQFSPQQTLQQLDASSQPVKTTVEQRAATLSKISKTSVHYTVTTQQELDTLSALHK